MNNGMGYAISIVAQDFYHAQMLDGNLCDFLTRNIDHVGGYLIHNYSTEAQY